MSTKKAFVELVQFLNTNKDKTIKSLWSEIELMTKSKKAEETIAYDKNGKPYAIFCYYHKQWEILKDVEYGKKASSKSGFNTMCKIGTNAWTKQQSDAKKKKNDVLTKVEKGEIKPSDILARLNEVEKERLVINKTNMPKGTKDIPIAK